MRVALVNMKDTFLDHAGDRPYLGNLYLAGYMREHVPEAEIKIFDLNHDDPINIVDYLPDMVGIGFTTPHYSQVKETLEFLKSRMPIVHYVAGGAHPTAVNYREVLDMGFDQVVQGEGEEALRKILEGDNSPVLREPYIENIDSIPMPAWDMIDMDRYGMDWDGNRAMTLFSSRGCPMNCGYCSKDIWGRSFRGHSPDRIAQEMDHLYLKYNIGNFYFYDDTFTIDEDRIRGFLDKMRTRGNLYNWKIITRADRVNKDLLKDMYMGGCKEVSFGIEHADDESLMAINKGMTVQQNIDAVGWAKDVGITVKGFFMVGLPYDTPQKIRDTVQLAKDLNLEHALFSNMMPYPGTAMHTHPEKFGLRMLDKGYDKWLHYAGYNTKDWPTSVVDIGTMTPKEVEDMSVWAKEEWNKWKSQSAT